MGGRLRLGWTWAVAAALLVTGVAAALADPPPPPPLPIPEPVAFAPSPITVTAVGDLCFTNSVGRRASGTGGTAPFALVRSELIDADVTVGNLETPLSNRGKAVRGKKYTFRASPIVAQGLAWAGFDLVAQGNNHARDYGPLALLDTFRYLDSAGVAHAGAGANRAAAFAPALIERNGARIAFLSFSQIGPSSFAATGRSPGTAYTMNLATVRSAIDSARRQADYVIVSFHWGIEQRYTPTSSQVRFGRAAVDAGADLVLSHHPHVIQGVEYYKGKLIAYSLGNFVFAPPAAARHDSMILSMTLSRDGVSDVTARPIWIDRTGRPTFATGANARRIVRTIQSTSKGRGTNSTVSGGVVQLWR